VSKVMDTEKKVKHSRRPPRISQATAYHEAGHAIAAWRLELSFRYVTVEPCVSDGSLGHILHRIPKWLTPETEGSHRARLHTERHIITDFAGQLAERSSEADARVTACIATTRVLLF